MQPVVKLFQMSKSKAPDTSQQFRFGEGDFRCSRRRNEGRGSGAGGTRCLEWIRGLCSLAPRPIFLFGLRTGGCVLREYPPDQPVVHQTQRRREESGLPRHRALDVVHQQLGILLGKVLVEDLDFHFHDRLMTEANQGV
jgi:hypothetical protein